MIFVLDTFLNFESFSTMNTYFFYLIKFYLKYFIMQPLNPLKKMSVYLVDEMMLPLVLLKCTIGSCGHTLDCLHTRMVIGDDFVSL